MTYTYRGIGESKPARAVDEMMRACRNVTRRHIRPVDYGLTRLQHMGFFHEGAEALWHEVIAWLNDAAWKSTPPGRLSSHKRQETRRQAIGEWIG